jgi:hypothetical protein
VHWLKSIELKSVVYNEITVCDKYDGYGTLVALLPAAVDKAELTVIVDAAGGRDTKDDSKALSESLKVGLVSSNT